MDLPINTAKPMVMHIDLNSCFATIEQQANPLLRDKPIAVAAYNTSAACVLAPSIEAKRFGVKTGMRVRDAVALCPAIKILTPDPNKYRYIYNKFCDLFSQYTPDMHPRSIDEAVLRFEGTPALKVQTMAQIGREIKLRMRAEIGDWLKCNVGIAPNAFLAKLAASLHKPDGLDIITHENLEAIYQSIELEDFNGINKRYHLRLNLAKIYTPLDFLHASLQHLRATFGGIVGYYWYVRLRGWEIDNVTFQRKTVGHSYHLPKFTADEDYLATLLLKLSEKMGRRLRRYNLGATGVRISCLYADGTYWQHGHKVQHPLYTGKELFEAALRVLKQQPEPKPVRIFMVNCFGLFPWQPEQLHLLPELDKSHKVSKALDAVNDRWGEFTIVPARMAGMEDIILDRIAFGNVRDFARNNAT